MWLEIAWAAAKFLNGFYDPNGEVGTPQLELVTSCHQQTPKYYITQLQLKASSLLVGKGSDLQTNDGNRACLSSSLPRDTEKRLLQFAK